MNDAVFDRITPSVDRALLLARDEAELWMLAGAKRAECSGRSRSP